MKNLLLSAVVGFSCQDLAANMSESDKADLIFIVQEEKLARDVYIVLNEYWNLQVFANISKSEQKHMNAISRILSVNNLPDPTQTLQQGKFEDNALQSLYDSLVLDGKRSLTQALHVGALIEEKDIDDLELAIKKTNNPSIISIYSRLNCGSRNHLRAFVKNLSRQSINSEPYKAKILPQEKVDQIIASEHEFCGKGKGK